MKAMYGRKLGMTRIFTEAGESLPVTVLELSPNVVCQVKTPEKDGYSAVQVGFGEQKQQRLNRAQVGHQSKAAKGTLRNLAEVRFDRLGASSPVELNVGDEITAESLFQIGARVDVVGNSIGKGFAGVMKRHGMKGFSATHGTHEYFRHGGSIGCRKFPGRVFKNKRMGGHMGATRVLQENLEVVGLRPQDNVLLVKGSVPGHKGAWLFVRESLKHKAA